MKNSSHLVIIGGGIGGSASALRSAQNGLSVIWFLGSKATRKRSRSQWVMNLDNIVGFHEDVIKNQIIKTLKKSGENSAVERILKSHYHINNRFIIQNTIDRIKADYPNITMIHEEVLSLERKGKVFLIGSETVSVTSETVILATGVMDEQPVFMKKNRQGLEELTPKWLYPFANREQLLYCIRCEGHLTESHHVAVIGFDNTCAEIAMMIHERYRNRVTILTNGLVPEISDDRKYLLEKYGIKIITGKIVDTISQGVKELQGFQLDDGTSIRLRFAFVSLGLHKVYNELAIQAGAELLDSGEPVHKRHILINHKGETTVRNFFVVGDAAKRADEPVMKQVYTAQEYAVRAADTIDSRKRKLQRQELLGKR